MRKSPNWCPNCEMETDWLVIPSTPNIVQCKNCGHKKTFPGLRVRKPKLKEPSAEEKLIIPSPKSLFEMNEKEIRSAIKLNLRVAEVGSVDSLSDIARILVSNPADAKMMHLLQILVHQNKAIIGQNELLYRLLSKKPESKAHK